MKSKPLIPAAIADAAPVTRENLEKFMASGRADLKERIPHTLEGAEDTAKTPSRTDLNTPGTRFLSVPYTKPAETTLQSDKRVKKLFELPAKFDELLRGEAHKRSTQTGKRITQTHVVEDALADYFALSRIPR